MDRYFISSILCAAIILFGQAYSSAGHLPVSASCTISCVVKDSAEWGTKTDLANLEDAESGRVNPDGAESVMLYTNSDVEIITSGPGVTAFSNDECSLKTSYILHYDVAKTEAAGGGITAWSDCDSGNSGIQQFISIPGDFAVEVILSGSAIKNHSISDRASVFSQSQTLTVCWK